MDALSFCALPFSDAMAEGFTVRRPWRAFAAAGVREAREVMG